MNMQAEYKSQRWFAPDLQQLSNTFVMDFICNKDVELQLRMRNTNILKSEVIGSVRTIICTQSAPALVTFSAVI